MKDDSLNNYSVSEGVNRLSYFSGIDSVIGLVQFNCVQFRTRKNGGMCILLQRHTRRECMRSEFLSTIRILGNMQIKDIKKSFIELIVEEWNVDYSKELIILVDLPSDEFVLCSILFGGIDYSEIKESSEENNVLEVLAITTLFVLFKSIFANKTIEEVKELLDIAKDERFNFL